MLGRPCEGKEVETQALANVYNTTVAQGIAKGRWEEGQLGTPVACSDEHFKTEVLLP